MTDDWLEKRPLWEREAMMKQAYRARLFTLSGYVMSVGCCLGFTILPIFGLSIHTINNITDGQRYFPLQTSYPYDTQKTPYFELTYLAQIIAAVFVSVSFTVPENFFGALVFHASAQCEILQKKLARLMEHGDEFRLTLRQLVQMHIRIIRFVNSIEISFNLLVLAHVICLMIIISCLGSSVIKSMEKDAENPPLIQVFTFAASVVNLMIHMFVYCVASEILASNSSKFIDAVYQSNFILISGKWKKDVVMIMMRSQTPLQLTAGKFFYLSLNAYLQFVKNTCAYISMLLTVNN